MMCSALRFITSLCGMTSRLMAPVLLVYLHTRSQRKQTVDEEGTSFEKEEGWRAQVCRISSVILQTVPS
jgi:hypothetical protein